MKALIRWAEHHFWVFILTGIGLGLGLPGVMLRLEPLVLPGLAFVLLLTYLKLDFESLKELRPQISYLIVYGGIRYVLLPIGAIYLLRPMLPEYWLGVVLVLAMPMGLTSPVLADVFKVAVPPALFLSVASHVISPISVPLVVGMAGVSAEISLFAIGRMLALFVMLPFILSILLRRVAPTFIERTKPGFTSLSLVLILIIIGGTTAPHAETIISKFLPALWLLFLLEGLSIALHLLGWTMSWKKPLSLRGTMTFGSAFINLALGLVLAGTFFGPDELLVLLLFIIPTNVGTVLFGLLYRKLRKEKGRDPQATLG